MIPHIDNRPENRKIFSHLELQAFYEHRLSGRGWMDIQRQFGLRSDAFKKGTKKWARVNGLPDPSDRKWFPAGGYYCGPRFMMPFPKQTSFKCERGMDFPIPFDQRTPDHMAAASVRATRAELVKRERELAKVVDAEVVESIPAAVANPKVPKVVASDAPLADKLQAIIEGATDILNDPAVLKDATTKELMDMVPKFVTSMRLLREQSTKNVSQHTMQARLNVILQERIKIAKKPEDDQEQLIADLTS